MRGTVIYGRDMAACLGMAGIGLGSYIPKHCKRLRY